MMDVIYRLGLCCYYEGDFDAAVSWFSSCFPLCGDGIGIAVICWHTLGSCRAGKSPVLLDKYHTGAQVCHHTAYEKAARACLEIDAYRDVMLALNSELDDLEYVIMLYGICGYQQYTGKDKACADQRKKLLSRDRFWPCYAYLAA